MFGVCSVYVFVTVCVCLLLILSHVDYMMYIVIASFVIYAIIYIYILNDAVSVSDLFIVL